MSDSEYDLTVSKKGLGALYPILKDAHGNIIDGFHRQNADPDWPCRTIGTVDSPVKLELARLAANHCRRNVPDSEKQQRIRFLIENGLKPKEIAEKTGISESTIYRHMPQELKDEKRSEAISEGLKEKVAYDTYSSKTQETPQPIRANVTNDLMSCDNCKMATHITRLKNLNGQDVCPQCYDRLVKLPKVHEKAATESAVKETWQQRKAQMSPQHSKMEIDLRVKLSEAGYACEMDRAFCLEQTVPDFFFEKENVAIYLDGEKVHSGKGDKDDLLRAKLCERYGVRVLALAYSGNSESEKEDLFKRVVNELSLQEGNK